MALEKKKDCGYCKTLGDHFAGVKIFNRALYFKYCESQNYFYVKTIDQYIGDKQRKKLLDLNEEIKLNNEKEYLNSYYIRQQYVSKFPGISNYYRFVIEIPRFHLDFLGRMITQYHDSKRQLLYSKLKRKFGKPSRKGTGENTKISQINCEEDMEIKNRVLKSDLFINDTDNYNFSNTLEGLMGLIPELKNQSLLEFSKHQFDVNKSFRRKVSVAEDKSNIISKKLSESKIEPTKTNFLKKFLNTNTVGNVNPTFANFKSRKNNTVIAPNHDSKIASAKKIGSPRIRAKNLLEFQEDKTSPKIKINSTTSIRKKSVPIVQSEKNLDSRRFKELSRKYSEQVENLSLSRKDVRPDTKQMKVINILKYNKFFLRNSSLQSIFKMNIESHISKEKLKTDLEGTFEKLKKDMKGKSFRVKTQASPSIEKMKTSQVGISKNTRSQGMQGDIVLDSKTKSVTKKLMAKKKLGH